MSHPRSVSRQRYQRSLRHLEQLESRTLLSASVTSYAIPDLTGVSAAYDSTGSLWILNYTSTASPSGISLDKIGVVSGNHVVTQSIDLPVTSSPIGIVAGPGGLIYVDDAYASGPTTGGIDVVDTGAGTVTQYLFATTAAETPIALTVTGDGAVWFVGQDTVTSEVGPGDLIYHHSSLIGRFDPVAHTVTEFTTGAGNLGVSSFEDSQAVAIAASGADSVWIAFDATRDQSQTFPGTSIFGTNRIGAASFDGTIHLDAAYAVNTGDVTADKYNVITSVVDGGGGSVWFTLANNVDVAPLAGADRIVEGVLSSGNLNQTAYILTGADAGTPLNVSSLNFDGEGNLWFVETQGSQLGYLGTSGFAFTDNPTSAQLFQTAVNGDGSQLSVVTLGDVYPIVQIDVTVAAITFSGSANDISVREDTAIAGNTLLATFVAPPPSGSYSATITWGDSTQSIVPVTDLGNNTYAVIVSGKSFATQGDFAGAISIMDGTTVAGTLNFTSHVSDIPLNVTSISAVPLLLRIVTAVGTFTDDGDLALSTFTATINWGDNSSSTGVIVRDPTQAGRYLVLAVHQYRTRGTYTVRLTVSTTEALAAITRATLTTTVNAR